MIRSLPINRVIQAPVSSRTAAMRARRLSHRTSTITVLLTRSTDNYARVCLIHVCSSVNDNVFTISAAAKSFMSSRRSNASLVCLIASIHSFYIFKKKFTKKKID